MKRLPTALLVAVATTLAVAAAIAVPAHATTPGHNGSIVFSANVGNGLQLWTVRENGHDLRQITHADGDASGADWSPDGRTIVFEFDPSDGSGAFIERVNADGTGAVNLTPQTPCCSGQPAFSADGRRIFFERFDPLTFVDGIWSMNADGSDQRPVIAPFPQSGFATDPNVSPDGRTLSFVAWDGSLAGPTGEPAQALFTSSVDGADARQLTPFSIDLAIKHDWAPDGRHIVVTTNANFFHAGDSANIATIRPDGSGLHFLTSYTGGDVNAFVGSYSPDGNWIVFRLENHGSYALYRMKADGTNLHAILPFSSFRPRFIDWGPRADDDGGSR